MLPSPARRSFALALCLLVAGVAVPARAADPEPATWRLLNTFLYQGVTWGQNVLNMEGGEANGIFPPGQIAVTETQPRTWVASPMSPYPVDFGTAAWTLEFGGNSVVPGVSWIPGVYDPETAAFTPAPGTPATASGPVPSTFTPTEPFVLPAGANPAVRVEVADPANAPAVVDTHDEMLERSPSSLSVAGGRGQASDPERVQARADRIRCDHAPAARDGCAEDWVTRSGSGADLGGGADLAVAPDGDTVFVTGGANRALNSDILTQALDPETGAVLWEDRYGHPDSVHDWPVRILLSPDAATLYLVGTVCAVPTTVNCTSNYDALVVAYDATTGARRWVQTYGGAGDQKTRDAELSPDGSTLAIAAYTSPIAGPLDPQDVLAVAVDTEAGALVWERTWAGAATLYDAPSDVVFDDAGSRVYLAATTRRSEADYDALALGYEVATGDLVLERRFDAGAGGEDRGGAVAVDGSTLYFAGGGVREAEGDGDAFVLALDVSSGTERWRSWHEGLWGGSDSASSLEVAGGAVLVAGSEVRSSVVSDAFAASYDPATGAVRWVERFDRPGRSYDVTRDMRLSPDGARVLVAVESGWFGNSSRDYVTLVLDASTGDRDLEAVYDGTGGGTEIPTAVAGSPDGTRVFVTGASQGLVPTTVIVSYEPTTIAYRLPG